MYIKLTLEAVLVDLLYLDGNIINGDVIYTGEYQQQINWISLRNYHNLDNLLKLSD